jgi:hypothetical protein
LGKERAVMLCFKDPKHKVDWKKHFKEGGPLYCPRGYDCHIVKNRDQFPGLVVDDVNLIFPEGLDVSKAIIMNIPDCPKWKGE